MMQFIENAILDVPLIVLYVEIALVVLVVRFVKKRFFKSTTKVEAL